GVHDFTRAGHIPSIPLPGGEMAIKEGWRTAVSWLVESFGIGEVGDVLEKTGIAERCGRDRISAIRTIRDKRQFSPLSSGMGRLFDAVSSLIGLCDRSSFEGEAAIALEGILPPESAFCRRWSYPFESADADLYLPDIAEVIRAIVSDLLKGTDRAEIALRFHNTIIALISEGVQRIREKYGINKVALSGGVFQNSYIMENVIPLLESQGLFVFTHRQVPCNDGCISLGQAYIIRERLRGV
ncbi:MAG: carbamoyltransferase HypF, partial [Nitrospirales bacterium]|nr:carbamoyltransferase HypF [Nitrospirales bacterium]